MPPKKKRAKKRPAKKTVQGKGFYDKVGNFFIRKGRRMKDGEKHAPVYTKDGFQWGSYIGPGTHAMDNIKKGVKPISKTDKVAQAHDLRYALSQDSAGIRAADIKMVNKVKSLQANKEDYRFNTYMARLPIQAKMKLEDWGILSKDKFANKEPMSAEDRAIAQAKINELEVEGYGRGASDVSKYAKKYKIRLTVTKDGKRVKKTQAQLKAEIKKHETSNTVRNPMFGAKGGCRKKPPEVQGGSLAGVVAMYKGVQNVKKMSNVEKISLGKSAYDTYKMYKNFSK